MSRLLRVASAIYLAFAASFSGHAQISTAGTIDAGSHPKQVTPIERPLPATPRPSLPDVQPPTIPSYYPQPQSDQPERSAIEIQQAQQQQLEQNRIYYDSFLEGDGSSDAIEETGRIIGGELVDQVSNGEDKDLRTAARDGISDLLDDLADTTKEKLYQIGLDLLPPEDQERIKDDVQTAGYVKSWLSVWTSPNGVIHHYEQLVNDQFTSKLHEFSDSLTK